jgi:hypothetical protein
MTAKLNDLNAKFDSTFAFQFVSDLQFLTSQGYERLIVNNPSDS